MSNRNAKPSLDKLLKPQSIAVVGASARPESYGFMLLDMLMRHHYPGPIYPINPRYPELQGLTCYASLESVPGPIDLAYIALPSSAVVEVVDTAGQLGVRGVVVPGAGFAEGGEQGLALQAQLVATAARYDIAICGPNNLGFLNYHERVACWVTNVPEIVKPGDVALVTQSGSVGIAISQDGRELHLGYLVGAGNEANVGAADYLDYFIRDERINVVLLFLETLRDPERFGAAADEARRRGKYVVVVKVGRSDNASRMITAHTGAIAGEDRVYDAYFRKHGIARVTDLDEMVELGKLASTAPKPATKAALAAITLSGGEAALIADLSGDFGLDIPDLEPRTIERLRKSFPAYATPRNPVDAYGLGWDERRFAEIIEAVVDDRNVGIIALCMDTSAGGGGDGDGMVPQMARICGALMSKTDKQFIYINNTTGSGLSEAAKRVFEEFAIPVLFGMRESLGAIAHWSRWSTPVVSERVRPPKLEWGPRTVAAQNESERLALLSEAGIPMVETHVVDSADAAWTTANLLGKTVMKGTAPTLLHKSEHGLVVLNLHGEVAVRTAYQQLADALALAAPAVTGNEILLQTMMDEGVELILGAHHHEGFGTVIAVGLGGTLVEVVKQASVRLVPIDAEAARGMLEETPAATLLRGTRGKGPFDFDAACEAIVAFAQFAGATEGHLRAIEINPLLVLPEGRGVCGLDAVFER